LSLVFEACDEQGHADPFELIRSACGRFADNVQSHQDEHVYPLGTEHEIGQHKRTGNEYNSPRAIELLMPATKLGLGTRAKFLASSPYESTQGVA
jgi:hypothetical protein